MRAVRIILKGLAGAVAALNGILRAYSRCEAAGAVCARAFNVISPRASSIPRSIVSSRPSTTGISDSSTRRVPSR